MCLIQREREKDFLLRTKFSTKYMDVNETNTCQFIPNETPHFYVEVTPIYDRHTYNIPDGATFERISQYSKNFFFLKISSQIIRII